MHIERCINCKGTGKVPSLLMVTPSRCPVCRGRRELSIPDKKRICPDCLGVKKIPVKAAGLPDKEPCKTCGATGFVDA